jgi:hypothetical protein
MLAVLELQDKVMAVESVSTHHLEEVVAVLLKREIPTAISSVVMEWQVLLQVRALLMLEVEVEVEVTLPLPNMPAVQAVAARAEVQLWQILQEQPASVVVVAAVVET